ncbi:hypothetical protein [uncultured Formosa sp.]|uniref:hypothetical protein n=1 Tax=uncultured Formosa sp. TaxID=255435 RepID=UPI00260F166F|nr:hypothetical protein [uncultured Formosa sp.]
MKLIVKHLSNRKPFWLGFFISFLGSLPLSYLNIIALEILIEQGSVNTFLFVFGIIIIEFFVMYTVSRFAKWLVKQKKVLVFIDVFTILFLLGIASYLFLTLNNTSSFSLKDVMQFKYSIVLGLLLNSLNFVQWPYWSGVYLYLFRTDKLAENKKSNMIFIPGALLGTCSGMLTFAYVGKFIFEDNVAVFSPYLNLIIALLFLVLGFIQLIQFSVKQYKIKNI